MDGGDKKAAVLITAAAVVAGVSAAGVYLSYRSHQRTVADKLAAAEEKKRKKAEGKKKAKAKKAGSGSPMAASASSSSSSGASSSILESIGSLSGSVATEGSMLLSQPGAATASLIAGGAGAGAGEASSDLAGSLTQPGAPPKAPSAEALALYERGLAYDKGTLAPEAGKTRRQASFECYSQAFEQGCMDAAFKLAQALTFGFHAVKIDGPRALEVVKRGMAAGGKHAKAFLAWAYLTGAWGLRKDASAAVSLLGDALKEDSKDAFARIYYAHLLLGAEDITGPAVPVPVEKDEAKAKYMFSAVAPDLDVLTEEGDLVAQVLLAELLTLGDQAGMVRETTRAKLLWRDAAEQGHAEAQLMIAQMQLGGSADAKEEPLFEKNEAEGVVWMRKAAEQGYVKALVDLGSCYLDGLLGVERDEAKGFALLEQASALDFGEAHLLLGNYLLQTEKPENMTRGFELIKKAADQDVMGAARLLGECYLQGLGCERDEDLGRQAIEKGAVMGDPDANQMMEMLYGEGGDGSEEGMGMGGGMPIIDPRQLGAMLRANPEMAEQLVASGQLPREVVEMLMHGAGPAGAGTGEDEKE